MYLFELVVLRTCENICDKITASAAAFAHALKFKCKVLFIVE